MVVEFQHYCECTRDACGEEIDEFIEDPEADEEDDEENQKPGRSCNKPLYVKVCKEKKKKPQQEPPPQNTIQGDPDDGTEKPDQQTSTGGVLFPIIGPGDCDPATERWDPVRGRCVPKEEEPPKQENPFLDVGLPLPVDDCGEHGYKNELGECECEDGYYKKWTALGVICEEEKENDPDPDPDPDPGPDPDLDPDLDPELDCGEHGYLNELGECECEDGWQWNGVSCEEVDDPEPLPPEGPIIVTDVDPDPEPCDYPNQVRNDDGDCECEDGYYWSNDDQWCIKKKTCPPGATFDIDIEDCVCEDPLKEYDPIDERCVPICPPGTKRNRETDECECEDEDMRYDSNTRKCVKRCEDGQHWDATTGVCVDDNVPCPEGKVKDWSQGGKCVDDPYYPIIQWVRNNPEQVPVIPGPGPHHLGDTTTEWFDQPGLPPNEVNPDPHVEPFITWLRMNVPKHELPTLDDPSPLNDFFKVPMIEMPEPPITEEKIYVPVMVWARNELGLPPEDLPDPEPVVDFETLEQHYMPDPTPDPPVKNEVKPNDNLEKGELKVEEIPPFTLPDPGPVPVVPQGEGDDLLLPPVPDPPTSTAEFMGNQGTGSRIFFIIDRSASMGMPGKKWKMLKRELFSTLDGLKDKTSVNIAMFGDRKALKTKTSRWMQASSPGLKTWINSITPDGETYPLPAILMAFQMEPPPDLCYFFTDGEFSNPSKYQEEAKIRTLNKALYDATENQLRFNTVTFGDDISVPISAKSRMRRIAEHSGGTYVHQYPPDIWED